MRNINVQYKELIREILDDGYEYIDTKRNVKCKQIDSKILEIDLKQGFPAINLKKLYWKGVVGELLWFLSSSTDIRKLWENNITIWDKDWFRWHKENYNRFDSIQEAKNHYKKTGELDSEIFLFDLGRIYGAQWRKRLVIKSDRHQTWTESLDQISNLIKNLKEQPMSRRHIVTAWNPAELDDMALPPCHWSFEIIVRPLSLSDKIIMLGEQGATWNVPVKNWNKIFKKWNIPEYGFTLKWHQRSVDTYLGKCMLRLNLSKQGNS